MQLYDNDIRELKQYLKSYPVRRLAVGNQSKLWQQDSPEKLLLRGDMAYELGGGTLPAVSGLAYTSSAELVPETGMFLCGSDLPEITGNTAYARLTLVRLKDESGLTQDEQWYEAMRRIEYVRYHVYPSGFMSRISAMKEREPVRVSKKALEQGLDFAKVGTCFLEEYGKQPEVAAVELLFITLPDFPYSELHKRAHRWGQITESLNHIFQNLKMDCSVCGLKEICDEVEGLKELHFGRSIMV